MQRRNSNGEHSGKEMSSASILPPFLVPPFNLYTSNSYFVSPDAVGNAKWSFDPNRQESPTLIGEHTLAPQPPKGTCKLTATDSSPPEFRQTSYSLLWGVVKQRPAPVLFGVEHSTKHRRKSPTPRIRQSQSWKNEPSSHSLSNSSIDILCSPSS
jgi:hypothetical protein